MDIRPVQSPSQYPVPRRNCKLKKKEICMEVPPLPRSMEEACIIEGLGWGVCGCPGEPRK